MPVDRVICSSWDDFIIKIRRRDRVLSDRVFRGQRDPSWGLTSSWHRGNEFDVDPAHALTAFRAACIGTPGFEHHSSWTTDDWWAVGRHHGLATPLLDWTRSPYVAAFFAIHDALLHTNPLLESGFCQNVQHPSGSVAVWEYQHPASEAKSKLAETLKEVRVLTHLSTTTHRQRAQAGVFTALESPDACDLVAYLEGRKASKLLRVFEIPARDAMLAMCDLHRMNIRLSTLFPDIAGFARDINCSPWFRMHDMLGLMFDNLWKRDALRIGDPPERPEA